MPSVQLRLVVIAENKEITSNIAAVLGKIANTQERDGCERKLHTKLCSRRRLLRGV